MVKHKDVLFFNGEIMPHMNLKEYLEIFESELWIEYWEEFEKVPKEERPDWKEWAKQRWVDNGTFGGGS